MPRPIEEQVVVIAGASSGMGLAAAQEMARRGAKVVLAARNAADLERAVTAIRHAGGEALAVPADVTDYWQVEALARRAAGMYGRIDSWVHAAAVSAYATFREQPLDDFRRVMEINFMGQVHGARAALPYLERTGGTLVCIGSALSDRGVPLQGAYCASKHALKGWIDSLRVELTKAGSPVRISLVKPSSINTPLFDKAKTQLGVQPQPIPPVYDPAVAVEAIIHAAEHAPRDVYVGGAGKLLSVVERISSRLLDFQQLRGGFDAQMTERPKSAEAPTNLYGPVAVDGGVRGDFTDGSKRRSLHDEVARHQPVVLAAAALAGLALGRRLTQRRRGAGRKADALPAPLRLSA
jgi:NAD(P)-dependent dehydrogenase (short-subunit alcohol dehydrogenase family)